MNFTKVIFGVGSRFPETSALSLWVITVKQAMALRVEMRFIYESDFVNKRKGFIVKDNPDWEIDSSTSLDLAASLDDISDFEAELKSADSDSVSEISSSSATNDDSDLYGEGASATKKKTVKERNLQRKLNRGEEMIVARNNQSSQPSSQDSDVDVELTRTLTRKPTAAEIKIGKQQRW